MNKFDDWLENEKDFVLKTEREVQVARAAWMAALKFIEQIVKSMDKKEGSTEND